MIPVGPDFQNPVESPNYAPVLDHATPLQGSNLPVSIELPQPVSVVATDLNSGDTLYYEWVLDYPPYVPGTTAVYAGIPLGPPASGPQSRLIPTTLKCDLGWALNGPTQHQLELVVGDRPLGFDVKNSIVGVPAEGGQVARMDWTVTLNCPQPGSQ